MRDRYSPPSYADIAAQLDRESALAQAGNIFKRIGEVASEYQGQIKGEIKNPRGDLSIPPLKDSQIDYLSVSLGGLGRLLTALGASPSDFTPVAAQMLEDNSKNGDFSVVLARTGQPEEPRLYLRGRLENHSEEAGMGERIRVSFAALEKEQTNPSRSQIPTPVLVFYKVGSWPVRFNVSIHTAKGFCDLPRKVIGMSFGSLEVIVDFAKIVAKGYLGARST